MTAALVAVAVELKDAEDTAIAAVLLPRHTAYSTLAAASG